MAERNAPVLTPLPERHAVELAAGSVVIERYHWEKANGRRGVQWLAQVVDRDGNLTLYKVCKTRVEALMVALERG